MVEKISLEKPSNVFNSRYYLRFDCCLSDHVILDIEFYNNLAFIPESKGNIKKSISGEGLIGIISFLATTKSRKNMSLAGVLLYLMNAYFLFYSCYCRNHCRQSIVCNRFDQIVGSTFH